MYLVTIWLDGRITLTVLRCLHICCLPCLRCAKLFVHWYVKIIIYIIFPCKTGQLSSVYIRLRSAVIFTVSSSTWRSSSRLEGTSQTRTTSLWETSWTEDSTVSRHSYYFLRSRWRLNVSMNKTFIVRLKHRERKILFCYTIVASM